ncbi:hybrid signal transduction histidine kinase M-like [Apis laboriosa]|uniref:hybrid signal transduction histidine kinase M-like n=1 Tax=Apis laboriosa TaxID=183418 RepID=UPI001CC55452|nr:hybrid signal transduction histidine kinase M-like [Apis laboriosa]
MFESDDWDLDQDFLNDIDDKINKYCSQKDNQESEPKRRKIDINNDSISSSISNIDCLEQNIINKTTLKYNENKESRKNLILGIFNKNVSQKNISKDMLNDPKRSCDNISSNIHINEVHTCENNQLPRKNLVLGILKNKNIQDKIIEDNTKNLKLQTKIKDNSSNINEKIKSTSLNKKINYQISKSIFENTLNNDDFKLCMFEHSRKQLSCNTLQKQFTNNIQSNNSIKNLLACKTPQNKKMTLIRKFPGPAGLLPDDLDSNILCVSYLNSLEENEMSNKETNTNNLSKYCSQNTKNLFTEGAWQLMLDDLPQDFLKDHNIATVKKIANMNGFNNTKVKFLAGIIEHIDYSHDNPPIILKDFTDNIRGILHRDIPLKYPGLLESNVVVLLHDVGLLKISGTFVSNKYQILISPSSLLAIYTSKGIIERTQYMKTIFENILDGKTKIIEKEKVDCISTIEIEPLKNSIHLISKKNTELINFKENIENNNKTDSNFSNLNLNETNEDINKSMNFDSDIFFSIPSNNIDSQNQKNFNSSKFKNVKHMKKETKQQKSKQSFTKEEENLQNDDKQRAEYLLKNLKKCSPDINEKKKGLSHNSKILQMNAEHLSSKNIYSKEIEPKILNNISFEKINVDKCFEKTISPSCHKKVNSKQEKNVTSIRTKLLQFQNIDILSPENSAFTIPLDIKEKFKNLSQKKSETSNSMHKFDNNENDSDDEMLSQLDMNIIFSNYSNKN